MIILKSPILAEQQAKKEKWNLDIFCSIVLAEIFWEHSEHPNGSSEIREFSESSKNPKMHFGGFGRLSKVPMIRFLPILMAFKSTLMSTEACPASANSLSSLFSKLQLSDYVLVPSQGECKYTLYMYYSSSSILNGCYFLCSYSYLVNSQVVIPKVFTFILIIFTCE